MQDQPYDQRPPLVRERDRIEAILVIGGVTVLGSDVSVADGMADIAWQADDGSRWLAVISTVEDAARDARDGGERP